MQFIYDIFGELWYIVIPELLYILIMGFRLSAFWALIPAAVYIIALMIRPVPVMAAVGAFITVHAAFLIIRSLIGDRLYKSKKAESDDVSSQNSPCAVPRLSGRDKDVQDELDEMKKPGSEQ